METNRNGSGAGRFPGERAPQPWGRGRPHPATTELMAYAEGLADRPTTIQARIAAHVATCPPCREEAEAMRRSLDCVGAAEELAPSRESTARLLLAARQDRRSMESRRKLHRAAVTAGRSLTYAACMAIVATVAYTAATGGDGEGAAFGGAGPKVLMEVNASLVPLPGPGEGTSGQEALAEAVMSPRRSSRDAWEREQRRAVSVLESDISEAIEALERNPFSLRAGQLLDSSRRRRMETLKILYAKRSL